MNVIPFLLKEYKDQWTIPHNASRGEERYLPLLFEREINWLLFATEGETKLEHEGYKYLLKKSTFFENGMIIFQIKI